MSVLAKELQGRGHRATFAGFPEMEDCLGEGLEFVAYGHDDWPRGSLARYRNLLSGQGSALGLRRLMRELARQADATCRDLPSVIDRLKPDFLIVDQVDGAASLVATALQMEFANIANALPLNVDPSVPPAVLPWTYDASAKGIRRNIAGYRVAEWIQRPITEVIRRHAMRLGRPDICAPEDAWSESCQITQCIRGLDFPRDRLPANFHYAGPFRGSEDKLDFAFHQDGRPTVFCSLGTLQGSRLPIFRSVAKAAADLDLNLLIAHGGMLDEREIAALPGSPLVRSFMPQRAVLARCALAVTHCGFNTVMDALSFGVPMVGLPIAFEQPGTAARLERAGAAEIIHRWRSPKRIRRAIAQVLGSTTYRDNAKKLQAEIASTGGVRLAADIIERAIGGAPRAGATRARAAPDDVRDDSRSGNS